MRKKLLALLMCATMVLGTSVTAMADSIADAKKIGKDNAQLIIDEYYKAAGTITGVAANGKNGSVKYGYAVIEDESNTVLGEYKPVVIYTKDSKDYSATEVYSKGGKLKAYQAKELGIDFTSTATTLKEKIERAISFTVEYVNYKDNMGATVEATNVYTDASGKDDKRVTKTAMDAKADESAKTYYDKDGNVILDVANYGTKYVNASVSAKTAAAAAGVAGKDKAVTVVDDNGSTSVMWVNAAATKTEKVDGFVDGTKNYVKKNSGETLVTGADKFLKSVNEGQYGKIYSQLSIAGEDFIGDGNLAVANALDTKKFTKDAAAVKITAYLQFPLATEDLGLETTDGSLGAGKAKMLYNYTQIQAGTYTFDADLISRTAFGSAEAVEVFQPGIAATEYSESLSTLVKPFNSVATVAVNGAITFDSSAVFTNGIFVFDKGELTAEPEADKNDGVSDKTDAATKDEAASPKTGDVAPIAALAVVMMGAFGAMVVASKKRA